MSRSAGTRAANERSKRHKNKLIEAGGRPVYVHLHKPASDALKLLVGRSESTQQQVINDLLVKAAERIGSRLPPLWDP